MKCLVIDKGHEPLGDVGATQQDGEHEYVYTNALGDALKLALAPYEVEVIFTHQGGYGASKGDLNDELQARAKVANDAKADLLLSLHHNAGPPTARGGEVYIHTKLRRYNGKVTRDYPPGEGSLVWLIAVGNHDAPRSFAYARAVQPIIRDTLAALGISWRGSPEQIMCADFGILRYTDGPCLLLETHYGSNKQDDDIADSPEFIPRLAAGIAKSLVAALSLPERPKPKDPHAVTLLVEGVEVDCSARLEDGRTRANVKELAQAMGRNVTWNGATRTVSVSPPRP